MNGEGEGRGLDMLWKCAKIARKLTQELRAN